MESDTALTTSGRRSLMVRRMRDVLEENENLKAVVDMLKERLSTAETKVKDHNYRQEGWLYSQLMMMMMMMMMMVVVVVYAQIREEVAEEMARRMSHMEEQLRTYRESLAQSSSSYHQPAAGGHSKGVGSYVFLPTGVVPGDLQIHLCSVHPG